MVQQAEACWHPCLSQPSTPTRVVPGTDVPGHPWCATPTSPGRGRAESTWPGTGVVPRRVRARSASNETRDCDSPSWVPLLLVVRSRSGRERASCRCGRETTTGSGGTHFGCRLERPSFRGLTSPGTRGVRLRRLQPAAVRSRRGRERASCRGAYERAARDMKRATATALHGWSRRGRDRASCRCGRETTTGSGGTHFGCRLERPSFRGLRPRAPVVSDSDVSRPRPCGVDVAGNGRRADARTSAQREQ